MLAARLPGDSSYDNLSNASYAAKHYDEEQLAALVSQIALINAWNRVNVIVRQPAGDYQPGMFG